VPTPTSIIDDFTYTPPPVYTATGTGAPPSYGNDTTAAPTVPTGPAIPSTSDVYEGAANRATVAGGALAGLLGVVAYLL
jgi:hypothetical protein